MVEDRILFGMPLAPELYLAALAAVQDYGWQLVRQKESRRRKGEWLLAIHNPNPQLKFLNPCFPQKGDWFEENGKRFECPVDTVFVDEWDPKREDWDLVYGMSADVAYEFSEPTKKTAAEMFGLLIGSGPATELPDLAKIRSVDDGRPQIAILCPDKDPKGEELLELLELNYSHCNVLLVNTDLISLENQATLCNQLQMVIGRRSFMTYVAAAMEKRVVELYETNKHDKWLAKWSAKYQLLYGDEFPVGLIWRAIEGVMEQWPIPMTT